MLKIRLLSIVFKAVYDKRIIPGVWFWKNGSIRGQASQVHKIIS
jgi:hypothetical protein